MIAQVQAEHTWFNDLIGNWEFTHSCDAGPDQPATTTTGRVSARSLGGFWFLLDCTGKTPEGQDWTSQFTLGYDPAKQRFVGTFVASMMTYLWIYEGKLDSTGKTLVLDCDGPRFDGKPGMAKYQDSIEMVDRDHWVLRSRMLGDDGEWHQFMEGHHRRIG